MAKEIFTVLKCDWPACGNTVKIPMDRPSDPYLTRGWVQVAMDNPEPNQPPVVKYFCRVGCAVNGMRLLSDIALTDGLEAAAKNEGLSSGTD